MLEMRDDSDCNVYGSEDEHAQDIESDGYSKNCSVGIRYMSTMHVRC